MPWTVDAPLTATASVVLPSEPVLLMMKPWSGTKTISSFGSGPKRPAQVRRTSPINWVRFSMASVGVVAGCTTVHMGPVDPGVTVSVTGTVTLYCVGPDPVETSTEPGYKPGVSPDVTGVLRVTLTVQ